jgi:lysozyme
MKTSPAGRAAIEQREGVILKTYLDTRGIPTLGVGHTSAAGPPKVTLGLKITAAQADEILARDLANVEKAINRLVKVSLNQNEFDALVSFVFNIGETGFARSTFLRDLNNKRSRAQCANDLLMWNKPPEIKGRRMQEYKQFLLPTTEKETT